MKLAGLLSLFLFVSAAPSFADSVYNITVDATSLSPATTGFIDLAFNGGFPATASISNFSNAGGSLDPATITTQGTVSGTLPGTVTLANDNADYDQAITFGPSISFQLDLAGTPSGNVGDVFTLSFFNSDFSGGLLTGNVNDLWLAQFQIDPAGNVIFDAFANPSGGPSFATIEPVSASPEPGTVVLLITSLAGVMLVRRRVIRRDEAPCAG